MLHVSDVGQPAGLRVGLLLVGLMPTEPETCRGAVVAARGACEACIHGRVESVSDAPSRVVGS